MLRDLEPALRFIKTGTIEDLLQERSKLTRINTFYHSVDSDQQQRLMVDLQVT